LKEKNLPNWRRGNYITKLKIFWLVLKFEEAEEVFEKKSFDALFYSEMMSKASIVVSFLGFVLLSDWHSSAGLTTNPDLHKVLRQRWHKWPECTSSCFAESGDPICQ